MRAAELTPDSMVSEASVAPSAPRPFDVIVARLDAAFNEVDDAAAVDSAGPGAFPAEAFTEGLVDGVTGINKIDPGSAGEVGRGSDEATCSVSKTSLPDRALC